MATPFGIYDLLRPCFLAGFNIPTHIDRYLSVLGIDELRSARDENSVVYVGHASFVGEGGALPALEHRDPSGAWWRFDQNLVVQFRLTLPRDGAAAINNLLTAPPVSPQFASLNNLFDQFGPVEQADSIPTEYPGTALRLELLFNRIVINLSRDKWRPGILSPEGRVIEDQARRNENVRFLLPNISFVYEQTDQPNQTLSFRVQSWGNPGFEAPADLQSGELVRMEPPIAVARDGRWGFGIDQVLIDLSPDHTPPEILRFFGTDEAFEGLYIKEARLFYGDHDKDFAFNLGVSDLLLATNGEISLEASLDLLFGPGAELRADIKLYDGVTALEHDGASADQPLRVPSTAVAHVNITGGVPPFTVSVKLDDEEIWDQANLVASLIDAAPPAAELPKHMILAVHITDSAPEPAKQTLQERLSLKIVRSDDATDLDGAPSDKPVSAVELPLAEFSIDTGPTNVSHSLRHFNSTAEVQTFQVLGRGAQVTVDNAPKQLDEQQMFSVLVPEDTENSKIQINVDWPGVPTETRTFTLRFAFGRPKNARELKSFQDNLANDGFITGSVSDPPVAGSGVGGLKEWLSPIGIEEQRTFTIHGHASLDDSDDKSKSNDRKIDEPLSERRRQVAIAVLEDVYGKPLPANVVVDGGHFGHAQAEFSKSDTESDRATERRAELRIDVGSPADSLRAVVFRKGKTKPEKKPPDPPKPQNKKPDFFRKFGLRIRVERGVFVLGEATGQVDFETGIEEKLRAQPGLSDQRLEGRPTPKASTAPVEDGVVDFVLQVTHDTATHEWTERLKFGASELDRDGLYQWSNSRTGNNVRIKDTFGALLTFAPVISQVVGDINPGSAGDWAKLGVSLSVPVTMGAVGAFQTYSATWHGAELRARQYIPPQDDNTFNDAAALFDYSVSFGLKVPFIGDEPNPNTPAKVRYRAMGFQLNCRDGLEYQPVFDTSRGYEIDLADPGLFRLKEPWQNILKVASARVGRVNPTMLEVDLRLNVDLGVVTFDQFKIKWPLDTNDPPAILPTGVKVDIPSTIIGSGSLSIRDDGFDGTLDVSLVALKLRMAGSLGLQQLRDEATGREATGIFVGLTVDFPAPIVLGASGLGLYGLSGLFGMHYKRLEPAPVPAAAASPALRWLKLAEGMPNRLRNSSNVPLWGPDFDRWSFGVGALMGTTEGGFLANFRGSLVVELPGPRILIFVKAQFLAELPGLGEDTNTLDTGLLGVLDYNFERREVQIGLLADFEVKKLLKIEAPIDVFFDLDNGNNWHVHLGTVEAPVRATVLGLGRGHGYFMVSGAPITNFPGAEGPITLPAIAIATGMEASVVLGKESTGLFVQVAAGAHLGIAFSPFHIVGQILLKGSLRLFVVSIGVDGTLSVAAPDPTIIRGEICGKVSFFFFSVKGCVGLTIGSGTHDLAPPPLVKNLYLQSFAPVIAAGQGGARPIDGSLGEAIEVGQGGALPVVPIDTVPVLQLHASPETENTSQWFTESPGTAPDKTTNGWIDAGGGRRIRYKVKDIDINPPLPGGAKPPATWRSLGHPGPKGAKTDIDLALISREPTAHARALERSTDLHEKITVQWGDLCKEIAPPACVLWTFCDEKLGPSDVGWCRTGIAWPDPPDTHRGEPAPDQLKIDEPGRTPLQELLGFALYDAGKGTTLDARIVGANASCDDAVYGRVGVCIEFLGNEKKANPLSHERLTFTVRDSRGDLAASTQLQNGLGCGHSLEVRFPRATSQVDLYLLALSGRHGKITAYNKEGVIVASDKNAAGADVVSIEAPGIRRLVVESPQAETRLLRLCYQGINFPVIEPGKILGDVVGTRRRRLLLAGLRARLEADSLRAMTRLNSLRAADAPSVPATPLLPNFASGIRRHPRLRAPGELRATNSTKPNPCCFRALQLPQSIESSVSSPVDFAIPDSVFDNAADALSVTIESGRARRISLYLALNRALLGNDGLRVKQINDRNSVIKDDPISALTVVPVSGVQNGLPARWADPMGPWREQVVQVSTFLQSEEQSGLVRRVVEIDPLEDCERIRLVVPDNRPASARTRVLLGVIEICSILEEERAKNDQAIQEGRLETVTGALSSETDKPLLAPNRQYTITVRYDADTDPGDGSGIQSDTDLTQAFNFRTDGAAPTDLEPWVLATSPRHETRYEFFQDPVRLIFNDSSVLNLFEAYGKQLKVVVRAADGTPLPADHIEEFEEIDAEISTPFRDFLEALVDAGLLPCIGEFDLPKHASFTVPVELRPLMDYTLDIEVDPPLPTSGAAMTTPLFRRSFSTGRFAQPGDLIAAILNSLPKHRALDEQLSGLPVSPGVHIVEDQVIQDAMRHAGQTPLAAPNEPGIIVFWVRSPAGDSYDPHAVMIDSPEPLWRFREEPLLEQVPDQSDPAYQRVVPRDVPSLEVSETNGNRITCFIRSPSGTRTIAMLKPLPEALTASPDPVELVLSRPSSDLYQLPAETVSLITLPLSRGAPWEVLL